MKKVFQVVLIAFFLMSNYSYAQKVKIKKGIVSVDKKVLCKVEKDDVVRWSFYINTIENEQLLYFKYVDWGQYGYYEAYKASDLDNILFEDDITMKYDKRIIKKLFKAKVLTNSGIDEKKLKEFSKKMGREYTRKRNQY